MLSIEPIGEYLRVAGYPDGSDWMVLVEQRVAAYGAAGAEHVWYADEDARVHVLHAPTRRVSATAQLEGVHGAGARSLLVAASRDGRRLHAVQWRGELGATAGRVHVVDVAAGTVVAVHGGLPTLRGVSPVERPDGRLLLPTTRESLVLLDPASGAWEESRVPGDRAAAHFLGGSPDGRWWVRFDPTSFPAHDVAPGVIERLIGERKAERRYGVTLQLWEAFPLRFVRRVVVAWLTVEELPDETFLADPARRPAALPSRRALWDAIAAATAAAGSGPDGGAAPRAAYPPAVAADDAAWKAVEQNLATLSAGSRSRVAGWQPDGAALWLDVNRFLVCVGVDGTVSPRLYAQRVGGQIDLVPAFAAEWREVVPLAGRKARVVYDRGHRGVALFDGASGPTSFTPVAIPAGRDRWQPAADDPVARGRAAAYQRLEALREERRRVVIPFAGWTEAGCVAAVDALAAQLRADFHRRAVDDEVRIVFASADGEIGEERFFTEAGARFPGVAPAIRRLVDRFTALGGSNDHLFSNNDEGVKLFGPAVRTLGVLDASALPTVRRYGALVDVEHEHYFTDAVVPAVVAAHGWRDEVVDFVFWVLAWHFYNSLQDYARVWREWGLRDAVVHREPRAFARHVAADLAETLRRKDDPGRYGASGLDALARQIPQPHEPWVVAFFGELERLAAAPPDAPA